jgi:hypothetical protein
VRRHEVAALQADRRQRLLERPLVLHRFPAQPPPAFLIIGIERAASLIDRFRQAQEVLADLVDPVIELLEPGTVGRYPKEECLMKLRVLSLAMAVAVLSVFAIAPMSAEAKPKSGLGSITVTDPTGTIATVSNLQAVFDEADNLVTIVGNVTTTAGETGTFVGTLLNATGSCQILHLELGPVDLDLLGLQVHLDQVVLDITAQSGSGNLLGNLLCAVANLLNNNPLGSILADLTDLLNQIFRRI